MLVPPRGGLPLRSSVLAMEGTALRWEKLNVSWFDLLKLYYILLKTLINFTESLFYCNFIIFTATQPSHCKKNPLYSQWAGVWSAWIGAGQLGSGPGGTASKTRRQHIIWSDQGSYVHTIWLADHMVSHVLSIRFSLIIRSQLDSPVTSNISRYLIGLINRGYMFDWIE
jgi:hypothetical protein